MFAHILTSAVHFMVAGASPGSPSGAGGAILKGAGDACKSACGSGDVTLFFTRGASILTYLVGAVSVLMVLYGGFRYVISRGDAANVKAAKDTILYAIVGVIVSIVAFAIVSFVAKSIG